VISKLYYGPALDVTDLLWASYDFSVPGECDATSGQAEEAVLSRERDSEPARASNTMDQETQRREANPDSSEVR
jgi:hypothetical protein